MHEASPGESCLQAVRTGDRLARIKGKLWWVGMVGCEGCPALDGVGSSLQIGRSPA